MHFRYLPSEVFVETIEQPDAGVRKLGLIITDLLPLSTGKSASENGSWNRDRNKAGIKRTFFSSFNAPDNRRPVYVRIYTCSALFMNISSEMVSTYLQAKNS